LLVRNKFAIFLAVTAIAALCVMPGFSWISQFTGSPNNFDRWDFNSFPVSWNLNPAKGSNIAGSQSVHDVIAASFGTWQAAPNTALAVSEGAPSTVSSSNSSPSNINLICFVCTDADFSQDSSTLAVTITTTADRAGESDGHGGTTNFGGQIIKSDIIFNPKVQYSTDGGSGENLQVIATHEIGHFFGLDHSPVVRAVMFPYASSMTTLSYDDVAGISTVYPSASPQFAPATITGRVSRSGGGGVFGAHVFAEPTTANQSLGANIRKSAIGTLTVVDGTYNIRGVPADSYVVTAEPLDDPVTRSDIDTYPTAFGQSSLQTNFTTRWH
jgi:hypothetical protein